MNLRILFGISFCCFMLGALVLLVKRECIVFLWPTTSLNLQTTAPKSYKKSVTLFFWHHNAWHQEKTEILWSEHLSSVIKQLVSKWLTVIDEEGISQKHVELQSVMLSEHNMHAYLSFDRNPIIKTASTYHNVMWFEGLLKTLRENEIAIHGVYFMAHHKPINDMHLDFSLAWPLCGFVD